MMQKIREWLDAIPFNDPLERRQAGLLQIMLLILIGGDAINLPISILSLQSTAPFLISIIANGLIIGCTGAAFILLRRALLRPAVLLTVVGLVLAIGIALIVGGFQHQTNTVLAFVLPIVLGGLALGRTGLLVASGLTLALILGTAAVETIEPGTVGFIPASPESAASIMPPFVLIIGVMSLFLDRFGASFRQALTDALARERELEALRSSLETTVAERTASLQATVDQLRASQETIRELGAPVIPVLPGVLVAPVIGMLDSQRAAALSESILDAVTHTRAQQVIFDITGVPVVDTQVAQSLLQIAAAVRLLGAQPLLVGIRAEVALTIITLGLDLANLTTYPNLQQAVQAIMVSAAQKPGLLARTS